MTEWKADLSSSALLIWDMQYGIAMKAFNLKEMIENIMSLIELMHSKGRPVIFSQTTGLPYDYQSKYSIYRTRRRGIDPRTNPQIIEGTHDWQLMDEFKPVEEDTRAQEILAEPVRRHHCRAGTEGTMTWTALY